MKRRAFSFVLMIAIVFSCFSGLMVIGASAEINDPGTPLRITHISATENYHQNKEKAIDWSKIWDTTNKSRLVFQFDEVVSIVGKLDLPTQFTGFSMAS